MMMSSSSMKETWSWTTFDSDVRPGKDVKCHTFQCDPNGICLRNGRSSRLRSHRLPNKGNTQSQSDRVSDVGCRSPPCDDQSRSGIERLFDRGIRGCKSRTTFPTKLLTRMTRNSADQPVSFENPRRGIACGYSPDVNE